MKIGFISPDMRRHSVAYFFEPLLAALDKERFETYCYAEVSPVLEDEVTARLKSHAAHWRTTYGARTDVIQQQIKKDGIDILIDLAGHTTNNRLAVFTPKPAPVTATWLGWPATTGVPTIDWRITNERTDPAGTEHLYTEKLMRLPDGFMCYKSPPVLPDVEPLPSFRDGYNITFGSFNNQAKITDEVIDAWAKVMSAVPGSRLLLKYDYTAALQYVTERKFEKRGISPYRLSFKTRRPNLRDHFEMYGQVDIALDTFPYNGVTTTCEALMMGVPVISLLGDRHISRTGFDILTQVGLEKFVAADKQEYVQIASHVAGDILGLAELRAKLRPWTLTSSLCDATKFARDFEVALDHMWGSR